ncbi:MAG: Type II secretion system protein F [Verrucomicrobia subdivision 3 bacterium]|nr:Type II secretion system protein F [Limisphaerales bacterium]MCS1412510.1 Type II secretion system protein F [Limisphaerales bacterium]
MAAFDYKAIQADGTMTQGSLEASGRADALCQIQDLGMKAVKVTEATSKAAKSSLRLPLPWQSNRISFSMLENFTRLLSSLLAAGVSLSRALVILYREAATPAAGAKWKEVHDLVVDGMSLADAMAKSPETFPRVYVAMVQAGEVGGFLDLVLMQIADFQFRDKELRGKVLSAAIYPLVLAVLAIAVLIFLLVFFIPRFTTIFEGFGAALPLLTRIIVGISDFFQNYGIFLVIGIFFAIYLGKQWLRTEKGCRLWEGWLLRAPVVGPLNARFSMARFCRMLGTLTTSGVPLVSALNVARKSIGNQILVDAIESSIERVKKGGQLANSLRDCRNLFPGPVIEMISVAEESGRLDQEFIRLADVTEKELDQQLKTAVALMEPAMLFLIAGFIGTIFVGMVMPIFTIQDYIK